MIEHEDWVAWDRMMEASDGGFGSLTAAEAGRMADLAAGPADFFDTRTESIKAAEKFNADVAALEESRLKATAVKV